MHKLSSTFSWFIKHYFLITIILFLLYSAVLIFKSSFVVHDVRYFVLSDDEMIGMRYANNLIHGHGLVWNPGGERVEGISNPLWVFIMALVHLLPIPLSKISIVIQILGAGLMVASLYFVKKIAELVSNKSNFVVFLSIFFTAFYYPLINWNVNLGTEVSILTLLITWSAYLTLLSVKKKKFSLLLFILLGLGIWVRMDFVIPAFIIIVYLLFFDTKNRKKYFQMGISVVAFFGVLLAGLRLWYYQELLPNTYYVKMEGVPILMRISKGIFVSIKAFIANVISLTWLLMFAPFIYAFFKKDKNLFLLLSIFTGLVLYNIYVGGDVWEYYGGANRFVAFGMPLFFISLFVTLDSLKKILLSRAGKLKIAFNVLVIAFLCLTFFVLNKGASETWSLPQLFFSVKPLTTAESEGRTYFALELAAISKPNAKIAVAAAGLVPYLTPRYYVDVLGKTDKVIAREPAKIKKQYLISDVFFQRFYPGHMKWDYPYIVKHYKPDIIAELYQRGNDHNERYLLAHGYVYMVSIGADRDYGFFILKDSPYVITKNLKQQPYPAPDFK